MKKIINNPDDFVNESIQGLVLSYPDIYKFSSETNKVLMVVDGVRMNNAIYRGGHLQNSLTIDNNALELSLIHI